MEDELTQPNTQQVLDPRRLGRNNSGLSDSDIADILCILHPASPAAFTIVTHTAEHDPQHVLQNEGLANLTDRPLKNVLEEHDTFLLGTNSSCHAKDLALRFSSSLKQPVLGFTFGRNSRSCDIVFDIDTVKRISNLHFRIFINHAGVVMLEDMSTNGTLVDENHLKGKTQKVATRMLIQGSVIQVPSTKPEESIKFIVRIPSRSGHDTAYHHNFQLFRARMDAAEHEYRQQPRGHHAGVTNPAGDPAQQVLPIAKTTAKPALVGSSNPFGMHWSGGDKYNIVGQLGKGAFATVFQLATKMDGVLYAAKELNKQRFVKNGRMDHKLENEMQIMKDLRHPNIVQYVDYHEENGHLYIIMEYVEYGDLQNYLAEHGPLHEPAGKLMARQTLKALQYLHRKRITHRDIKPDNILIASLNPFKVKLSDFGLSKVVKDNETFLKTFCGTLLYCAPEVFPHYGEHTAKRGTKRRRGNGAQSDFHAYSQSVDIWSFAAVLWNALCCKPPFEGRADKTGKKMFDHIMGTPLDASPLRARGISESAIDLLFKMLNTDPSERPSEKQCLQHPWIASLGQDSGSEMEDDLHSIAEEPDEEGAEEVFSQLSINDVATGSGSEQNEGNDEDYEMPGFDSDDMDFLDPRASKRVKEDMLVPRNQIRDQAAIPSSPDELSDEAEEQHPLHRTPRQQRPGRLFGEISASALQSSGVLGERTNRALNVTRLQNGSSTSGNSRSRLNSNGTSLPDRQITSDLNFSYGEIGPDQSLGGAESMVRDLNMESLESNVSTDAGFEAVAKTPESVHGTPKATNAENRGLNISDQATPRPKPAKFSRLIQLNVGPSFYYDPYDLSTENPQYSSKVSGRDFAAEAAATDATKHLDISLQATMQPPTPQKPRTRSNSRLIDPPGPVLPMTVPVGELEPPARLGMLISSTDSFTPIFWKLNKRVETWGRGPNNTLVYPDRWDVRIPKMGVCIFHHAMGIEKLDREGRDWRSMPGLHTLITTCSSVGIWVNGLKLREKNENGNFLCGRVYSGDVITAFASKEDGQCLRFVCKFEHGEAKNTRPLDKFPFEIEETVPKQAKEQ